MKKEIYEKMHDAKLKEVRLEDSWLLNAEEKELFYLKSLSVERLLKGFGEQAGVIHKEIRFYPGWEDSAIKGHTLGHYMTAIAQAYASGGDKELKARMDQIIDALSQYQAKDGYLAAIPREDYKKIEEGNTAGTWVPWYTMHKVLSGIIMIYRCTKNEKALKLAENLGNWIYLQTSTWDENKQRTVLSVEYGGMNDCLYDLYEVSGKESFLKAAHAFDEMDLFQALYEKKDVLNGLHANTTIPKVLGALNRYLQLGEGEVFYLEVAKNFFDLVVNHHTYVTGGNSEWEHFGEPDVLDLERTNCNCETCNIYNMLKLARGLYKITGEKKYEDYF